MLRLSRGLLLLQWLLLPWKGRLLRLLRLLLLLRLASSVLVPPMGGKRLERGERAGRVATPHTPRLCCYTSRAQLPP